MYRFFWNRLKRKKTCWIALLAGNLLSAAYIVMDVFPNAKFGGNPYLKWIESFTASDIPTILFLLMPIISSLACADLYLADKKSGVLNILISKGQKKPYFKTLFVFNFLAGGLVFISALVSNIYLCFMLLQNQPIDMLVNGNGNVPLLFSNTLFPSFYYAHPFLHMLMYVVIAFLVAGMYASLALAFSFYLKETFMVFVSSFVLNYVFVLLLPDTDLANSLIPTIFAKQISGPILNSAVMLVVFLICMAVSGGLYIFGVKQHDIL